MKTRFVVTQEFVGKTKLWAVWDTVTKRIVSSPLWITKSGAELEAFDRNITFNPKYLN